MPKGTGKNKDIRTPRKIGRPPVPDEELIAKVEKYLLEGFAFSKACKMANLDATSYYRRYEDSSEFRKKVDEIYDSAKERVFNAIKPYLQRMSDIEDACIQAYVDPRIVKKWYETDFTFKMDVDREINFIIFRSEEVLTKKINAEEDKETAKWVLERIKKKKYSTRTETESTNLNLNGSLEDIQTYLDGMLEQDPKRAEEIIKSLEVLSEL
jgi:hypothetical protein